MDYGGHGEGTRSGVGLAGDLTLVETKPQRGGDVMFFLLAPASGGLEVMHKGKEIPSVSQNSLLCDALIEVSNKGLGITLVKNKTKVVGIFTDGDLRRCLNEKIDINKTKIKDVMTKSFKTIRSNALAVDAAKIMEENKIFTLVVMNKEKNVGVISMHDLITARIL